MATLYELKDAYRQLLEMAEDPTIPEEAISDTMEAITDQIEDKADAYAKVITELKGKIETIGGEIRRLSQMADHMTHTIDRMKESLYEAMTETGKTKFKTALYSFAIQKNPAHVVMDEQDVTKIPDIYKIMAAPKIDKKAILSDLKAGRDLGGIAHLEQDTSLRIR